MNPDQMFNWSSGDVILRTQGTDSRDFRVHKLILSLASPVFKDMFAIPQPSSAASGDVDVVDVADSTRALEVILQFIYPSPPPVIDTLILLSEVLVLADKYDIEAARSRSRQSLVGFAKTEPLRVYAIASRLGYEDEMKIASTCSLSTHLSALTQLPDEFKLIPATEYHRLIHLHARYRKEVAVIVINSLSGVPMPEYVANTGDLPFRITARLGEAAQAALESTNKHITDAIIKGTPLDYVPFTLALKTDYGIDVEARGIGSVIHSILNQANALNLTV